MKPLTRRSVTTGLAAAVTTIPAVGLAKGNLESSELRGLIEAHRAAYRVFSKAIDYNEEAETPARWRALVRADRAEEKALLTVCAYRCKTLEEAKVKAEYLLTTPSLKGTFEDHELALLESFIGKETA